MIEELSLECPYKIFKDTVNNIYFFETQKQVRYTLYLSDASDYFIDFHLVRNVFLFGFEPTGQSLISKKMSRDSRIKETILAFVQLLMNDDNRVLTFVADISDSKQKARSRLFNQWKNENDFDGIFDKYDVEIESDEQTYYSTMIIRKNNIHKSEYKKAFLLTADDLTK